MYLRLQQTASRECQKQRPQDSPITWSSNDFHLAYSLHRVPSDRVTWAPWRADQVSLMSTKPQLLLEVIRWPIPHSADFPHTQNCLQFLVWTCFERLREQGTSAFCSTLDPHTEFFLKLKQNWFPGILWTSCPWLSFLVCYLSID